jgi:uncharacterized protein YqgC (DUF456 family)
MSTIDWLATVVAALAILVGVAGTVLPLVPGLLLVWGTIVAYGFFVGYGAIGATATFIATLLLGTGLYLNLRIPQRSAAAEGLTIWGQLMALAAGIVAAIVIPVIGFPIGFIGAIFVQRLRVTGRSDTAWTSTTRTMVALIKGSAAQALCGVGMFLTWAAWASTVIAMA